MKDRNEREVLLRMKGEQLFGKIAKELNEFFPEERTREMWVQICVALALAEAGGLLPEYLPRGEDGTASNPMLTFE